MKTWEDLKFWTSGEWQVIEERLDELDASGSLYCPKRELIFAGLDACPLDKTKVVIVGQDPYPDREHACGLAFSVLPGCQSLPPTLANIFTEYQDDLHYQPPSSGDLGMWCREGVLLWNAYPTCAIRKAGSHRWTEWDTLTTEILGALGEQGCVFAFLGSVSGSFERYVTDLERNRVIRTSHPSPLTKLHRQGLKHPFNGSRLFSTINAKLAELGREPVDWRLP